MSATRDRRLAERVTVEPHATGTDTAIVEIDGAVRFIVDDAHLDGSDNLTFYRDHTSVAHVKIEGVPLEVPNLVRRAIRFGEPGEWA